MALSSSFSSPEEELKLLKTLVENASDGVHILNQNGDVVYCSNVFAELLGYSLQQARTLNVRDWDRHFPVEQLVPVVKDLIVNPQIFITKHEKKSGEIFDVEINARGIELNGELYLYASSRDITDIKREAIENRINNARLNTIFGTMPDAFFVINDRGIIEGVNEKSIKMFGYAEQELIGENISKIMPAKYGKHHDGYLARYKATGESSIIGQAREFIGRKKDGTEFPVEINAGEAATEEGRYFTSIVRDISESKRQQKALIETTEQAKAAEKAKSLFLANMSHEIRTPMNGILGMVHLLQDTELNDKQQEMLSIVQASGDALLTIINDILDLSKIESGNLSLEKRTFELSKCLEEVVFLMANIASERGITITKSIGKNVPDYLVLDEIRLKQILTNLLNNAVKFSHDKTSVDIHIDAIERSTTHCRLTFAITDHGVGMTTSEQEKLFKEFSQVDETITRQYGGTGLGLSICSKLATLMDGKVLVESKKGFGSTFTLEIPAEIGKKTRRIEISDNFSDLALSYPHEVLVVEDNLVNQKLAQMMLEKLGYCIDIANNGQEALDAVKEKQYSLIFMDMHMPVMDGIEATQHILLAQPHLPIIAMTANIMEDDKMRCFEAGMRDFISKPFVIKDIAQIIQRIAIGP